MLSPKPRLGIRRHYNSQDRAQIGCDCNGFGACSSLNQVFDRDVNSKGYRASVRIRHASRGDGNEDDEQHRGGARSWRDAPYGRRRQAQARIAVAVAHEGQLAEKRRAVRQSRNERAETAKDRCKGNDFREPDGKIGRSDPRVPSEGATSFRCHVVSLRLDAARARKDARADENTASRQPTISLPAKNWVISVPAVAGASEPCTEFSPIDFA
jgi:hypothetical protein